MKIGIDIGGTFTDVYATANGDTAIAKVPSQYPDPSNAIGPAIRAVLQKVGLEGAAVVALMHGTTVATNAVIERKLATVGLITTHGFKDILAVGRQTRNSLYHIDFTSRWVPVPAELRLEIEERTEYTGEISTAPNREEVLEVAARLIEGGATAICVALLHSYRNDENERAVASWIRKAYPGIDVWTSAASAPEFREYERFSTAVLDAALGESMTAYLHHFTEQSRAAGVVSEPYLMESSGGVTRMSEAAEHPTRTLLSGPAGGVLGAINLARRYDRHDLLTFDMGGTSADIGVIRDGSPEMIGLRVIEDVPVLGSTVALEAIGAGGGSIAFIDSGGRLQVGPRSAGSQPGPACYGNGGTEATVTDAHVVLGTLPEAALLGNSFGVDRSKAIDAVERSIANPLGIDVISAAHAIITMVNTNMALAARKATVSKGIDPRSLTLVAYGGAGPLHAAALAQELGVQDILLPAHPGMLSALGLLVSDLKKEFVRSFTLRFSNDNREQLSGYAEQLLITAEKWREEQGADGAWSASFEGELRYVGQEFALRAPLPRLPWDESTFAKVKDEFDDLHEQLNGYRVTGEDIEIISLRLTGAIDTGGAEVPLQYAKKSGVALSVSETPVWWTPSAVFQTPIFSAPDLQSGKWIQGPAILVQEDSTCAIPPEHRFRIMTETGGIAIQRHTSA